MLKTEGKLTIIRDNIIINNVLHTMTTGCQDLPCLQIFVKCFSRKTDRSLVFLSERSIESRTERIKSVNGCGKDELVEGQSRQEPERARLNLIER